MSIKLPPEVESDIRFQTPRACDLFKSYYHMNHYVDPVDLKRVLPQCSCPDSRTVQQAQKITSLEEVRRVLSETFTYDIDDIQLKNKILTKNGFRILGVTPVSYNMKKREYIPFYSVSEHPLLPGWIIKAGGPRTPANRFIPATANDRNETNYMTPYESLMRLVMNQRIRQVAKEMQFDLVVPDEFAVPYQSAADSDIYHSYFVISKKLNLLSPSDSVTAIEKKTVEEQIRIAKTLCSFIKKSGYTDANFENIRLTKDGKIAIIDTEPIGLLIDQADSSRKKGYSLEKCGRIGLGTLRRCAAAESLPVIAQVADEEYQRSLQYDYSINKIALSLLCPLIPIVLSIVSVFHHNIIRRLVRQMAEDKTQFYGQHANDKPSHLFWKACNEFLDHKKQFQDRYLPLVENVFASASK